MATTPGTFWPSTALWKASSMPTSAALRPGEASPAAAAGPGFPATRTTAGLFGSEPELLMRARFAGRDRRRAWAVEGHTVDSGPKRNGLSKADLDVSAKLAEQR